MPVSQVERFCQASGRPYACDAFGTYYLEIAEEGRLPYRIAVKPDGDSVLMAKSFSLFGRKNSHLGELGDAIFNLSEGIARTYVGDSGFIYLSVRVPLVEAPEELVEGFLGVCEDFDGVLSAMSRNGALDGALLREIFVPPQLLV